MARRLREHDDRALATAAAAGDREAAEELLRRHHATVTAVCRRIVIDRGGAADAAQEALIAVARGLPGYDGRAQVRTWIHRIAVNAALDEVRRTRRRPVIADADRSATLAAPDPGPLAAVADRDEVSRALAGISEDYRAVLVLRYLLDMEYSDISEALGIPVGTVRSRLSRGTDALRGAMAGNPAGGSERQNSRGDSSDRHDHGSAPDGS